MAVKVQVMEYVPFFFFQKEQMNKKQEKLNTLIKQNPKKLSSKIKK